MRELFADNNATTHGAREVLERGCISIGAPLW